MNTSVITANNSVNAHTATAVANDRKLTARQTDTAAGTAFHAHSRRSVVPRPWSKPGAGYVVAPELALGNSPAAQLLHLAHTNGPLQRDKVTELTDISRATGNRNIVSLVKAGVIEEREDLSPLGAIGRPALPFAVRTDRYAVVGIYIGRWHSSVTLHDLNGKILSGKNIASGLVNQSNPGALLSEISEAALQVLSFRGNQEPTWVGIAVEASVTGDGVVTDKSSGWENVNVGSHFATALGLPVSLAPHVEAMASAELWNTPATDISRSTLYVYARETLGVGLIFGGQVNHSAAGSGTFGNLPAGPTTTLDPFHTGTVAGTVADSAIIAAAQRAGLTASTVADVMALAGQGNTTAKTILRERAIILGETVSSLVDLLNPSRIVLGGQAFTDHQEGLQLIAQLVKKNQPGLDLRVSAAGARVQQQAAGAIAITAIAHDPLHRIGHRE